MTVLGREIDFELLETAWNGGEARSIRESTVSLFDLLDELQRTNSVQSIPVASYWHYHNVHHAYSL